MKIVVGQCNPTVGAIQKNIDMIREIIIRAKEQHASLVVFPSHAVSGFPLYTLHKRKEYIQECRDAVHSLVPETNNISVILAIPEHEETAIVLSDGRELGRQLARDTSAYVWDLGLYVQIGFGEIPPPWNEKAEQIIQLAALPWHLGALSQREGVFSQLAQLYRRPFLLVNQVGGNDGWIFDGSSMLIDSSGTKQWQAPSFQESVSVVGEHTAESIPSEEQLFQALLLGLRDYVHKQGFEDVVIATSGGIDSSVTAALAAFALGAEHVHALFFPYLFTSQESRTFSHDLASSLGIRFHELSIDPIVEATVQGLGEQQVRTKGLTFENIQSRIRSVLLMAWANAENRLVLATGNKTESALGYATLYGDICGALSPIGDLFKTEVYALGRWMNREKKMIPEEIFSRQPTAELHPDQKDTDDWPSYDQLDPALRLLVAGATVSEVVHCTGMQQKDVERFASKMWRFEYKRRQSPPPLRVSQSSFGHDICYPIVNRFGARF